MAVQVTYRVGTPHPEDVALTRMIVHQALPSADPRDVAHFYPSSPTRAACGYDEPARGAVVVLDGVSTPPRKLCNRCVTWVREQREYDARVARFGG